MIGQLPENLLVGTSSWSSQDWCGSFYPESIRPGEMIAHYALSYRTVEIDATWHTMPNRKMVDAWSSRTPADFLFSAKVPKIISHEKYLVDCEQEMKEFLSVMSRLEGRLGPLILQFPYVAKGKDASEYATGAEFLIRLKRFIPLLSREFRWGIEIRNSRWIGSELLDLLKKNQVALVFIDYYTMDPLPKLAHRPEVFTAPFTYIRFLGNHKQMDDAVAKAKAEGIRKRDWESLIVDRSAQMREWIPPIREIAKRGSPAFIYFNNHYAGYAPGSVELFTRLYLAQSTDE
jgi:uncharacterized protein YecE (DUF72 family)